MTRQRWFCSYCGALTSRPSFDGRFARCPAHSTLPREADLIPPDPITILPTMAAQSFDWQTYRAQREDESPTEGSGA